VTREDLRAVLAEVLGHDPEPDALDRLAVISDPGTLLEEGARVSADWTVLSCALTFNGMVTGHLFAGSSHAGRFSTADERVLSELADHASITAEKATFFMRMRNDLTKTVAALSATLDAKERYAGGHSDRVMDYAMAVAEDLELSIEDMERLRFAGLLHDVGNIGVSEEILLKPSRLSEEEMAHVRRHAEIGASIVEQIEFLTSIAPIIMHHHERWDGEGYPAGLAGEEIPMLARVLAVADAFDAMTADRTYRRALPFATARLELARGAGTQFDPRIVSVFLRILDRRAAAGALGVFADVWHRETGHLPT
jgi:putative nucleotidyltransferase with HDIG domain